MRTIETKDYVTRPVEYMVGVGLINEPVYYLLGIYKTKEAAIEKKRIEVEKARKSGNSGIKFYLEELQVFENKN